MAVGMRKKLVVVALLAAMATPVAAASAAAPAAKKLSISQGRNIYDKAVKTTNAWLVKTPHTVIFRMEDRSNLDLRVDTQLASIDRNRNLFMLDNDVESYLIGDTLYSENVEGGLAEYELAIAQDLGLNVDARFAIMHPVLLDPDYPTQFFREAYSTVADQGFTGNRVGAKSTTVTYSKSGSTELLTVTLTYSAKNGVPSAKRVLTTKIVRGVITATTDTNTSANEVFKATTTYRSYTGTIVAPVGPYLDWDKVYRDPRYGFLSDETIAGRQLAAYVRQAQALAAFEGLDKLTPAIWELVAKDYPIVVLFDKGIEFTFANGSLDQRPACGVFTDTGATLAISTCVDLGFTAR